MSPDYPQSVQIIEVAARDGLQSEQTILSTTDKIEFINDLSACGHSAIEVSSFVNPQKIPQLADAEKLFASIKHNDNCVYSALIANQQGLERALKSGVRALALVTAASEIFCKKNINRTIEQSLENMQAIIVKAKQKNIFIRVYISCVFDCPFQGDIAVEQVCGLIEKIQKMNCDEISLADTTGKATPLQVEKLLTSSLNYIAADKLAMHFHDSYGQALANVLGSLQLGITRFDTSVAGIGGCNFSPGATGNLATEDIVFMLHGMGIQTGINSTKLRQTGNKICTLLGHDNMSRAASTMNKVGVQR